MKPRHRAIASTLAALPNGQGTAQDVAHKLGYRPARTGIVAVSATLRAMERGALAGRIPPETQWDSARWFLTQAGKRELVHGKVEAGPVGRHCVICGRIGGAGMAAALGRLKDEAADRGLTLNWSTTDTYDGKAHGPCFMRARREILSS